MGVAAGLLQAAVAADNAPAAPPAPGQQAPPAQPNVPSLAVSNAAARSAAQGVLRGQPAMPAPKAPAPPPLPPGFKDQKEQMSYAIGMSMGQTMKQGMINLDLDVLTGAMKDFMAGKTMRMTEEQMGHGIQAWRVAARGKAEEERLKTAQKNRSLGEAFLAENKKKEGVKTLVVPLPGGKTAEMQYKIITEGTGPIPASNEVVSVKYRGTTIDGKEFDNSSRRGPGPVRMMVTRAPYKGWSAAWEQMKVGSKWELYMPSALAGGDFPLRPPLRVEAGSTLIYEMELTGAEAPPAPRGAGPSPRGSGPGPLTSDIIRVPSSEEIKKGAKPEIIKAEDAEKKAQSEKKQ